MEYKALDTPSETDKRIQGYVNLNLAIVLQACIDGDKEWFMSNQFASIVLSIPDKTLQREMGIGLIDMTPRQIGLQLIKRIENGDFRNRKSVY